MKFSGKVSSGPMNKGLNFSGDPDDTAKTCIGGGMQCPSASSSVVKLDGILSYITCSSTLHVPCCYTCWMLADPSTECITLLVVQDICDSCKTRGVDSHHMPHFFSALMLMLGTDPDVTWEW